jgi:hypothetical protein
MPPVVLYPAFAAGFNSYSIGIQGLYLTGDAGELIVSNLFCLTAIAAIIPIVALITIFLYKKRPLQIRLSIVNIILLAGYYAVLFIYFWQIDIKWNLTFFAAIPLINIIFYLLAIKAIAKDEALIKSLNRLR